MIFLCPRSAPGACGRPLRAVLAPAAGLGKEGCRGQSVAAAGEAAAAPSRRQSPPPLAEPAVWLSRRYGTFHAGFGVGDVARRALSPSSGEPGWAGRGGGGGSRLAWARRGSGGAARLPVLDRWHLRRERGRGPLRAYSKPQARRSSDRIRYNRGTRARLRWAPARAVRHPLLPPLPRPPGPGGLRAPAPSRAAPPGPARGTRLPAADRPPPNNTQSAASPDWPGAPRAVPCGSCGLFLAAVCGGVRSGTTFPVGLCRQRPTPRGGVCSSGSLRLLAARPIGTHRGRVLGR